MSIRKVFPREFLHSSYFNHILISISIIRHYRVSGYHGIVVTGNDNLNLVYFIGSTSDEDRDGHDNVFEDQASPQFRSDTEASPPASPTLLLTLKSEQTLSKVCTILRTTSINNYHTQLHYVLYDVFEYR